LNAIEWFSRYCEYLTEDLIISAAKNIQDSYLQRDSADYAEEFIKYHHTSEAIPTIS